MRAASVLGVFALVGAACTQLLGADEPIEIFSVPDAASGASDAAHHPSGSSSGGNAEADATSESSDSSSDGVDSGSGMQGPVVLAPAEGGMGIAVDAANVYWTNGTGTVMKVPISGGARATLASGIDNPSNIVVDAMNVYWLDQGHVQSVPIGGGTPMTLASAGQVPRGLAVDATRVYWGDDGLSVNAVMIGGGPITNVGPVGPSGPFSLATGSGRVYWANAVGDFASPGIWNVPASGGNAALIFPGGTPDAIAHDATDIYWTDPTGRTVMKASLTGGTPMTLASDVFNLRAVAVNATAVYVLAGGVLSVPISGGTPTTLATGTDSYAIAVDTRNVYWTTSSAVMKLAL